MEISFEKFQQEPDEEKPDKNKGIYRKKDNTLRNVLLGVIFACLVIDVPIWIYFNFVKGVSVWDGIVQLRSKIHGEKHTAQNIRNTDKNKSKIDTNERVSGYSLQENLNSIKNGYNEAEEQRKIAKHILEVNEMFKHDERKTIPTKGVAIYSWINSKGHRVFSDKGFPENQEYTDAKLEWK